MMDRHSDAPPSYPNAIHTGTAHTGSSATHSAPAAPVVTGAHLHVAHSSRASRTFERVGIVSARVAAPVRPLFDRLCNRLMPTLPTADELDWVDEADWARLQQEPLAARRLLLMIVVVFFALLLWAAFAPIDEVTRGEGRVIPSSRVQVVQAVDGGVVEGIQVREGQEVKAGELLLWIDPTRFISSALENRSEFLSLSAKAARLQALTGSTAFEMPAVVTSEAPDIATHERKLFDSSKAEIDAQVSIARQQLTQREQELAETRARYDQAARGLGLANQELEMTLPLVATGAVSNVDIIRLRQTAARLSGERNQAAAQISRMEAAIRESQRKVEEIELNVRNQWRNELSDTLSRLGSLTEGARALDDKVKRAEVRSPGWGTVQRLLVNTVGAVVQPGKDLVEIVPLGDDLLLEARIQPRDIAFLRPGLPALVKFTAYDFSVYGGLDGVVENISPDTVTDEKGNVFYVVQVRTRDASLGKGLPVIPGMVAEINVLTGKKTVLAYLLKPILRAHANAMQER
jgi:adhesin transport system membrane fusion protein